MHWGDQWKVIDKRLELNQYETVITRSYNLMLALPSDI